MENKQPGFLIKALDDLASLKEYAEVLIQSGKLPIHFYEVDQYKNPIKNAEGNFVGNSNLVVAIIQFGIDMGMSVTEALRHLIPMRGVVAIKGDGAKARIIGSGMMAEWKETISGSIEDGTYSVSIYSKRTNGMEKTETFNVERAKRMGLWITTQMANKHEWFKKSPWYKSPERMIAYRALGFISRDLYPDVLNGIYLAEEAQDLEEDNTKYVEGSLTITPEKSEQVEASNDKVVEQIKEKESKRAKKLASGGEKGNDILPVEKIKEPKVEQEVSIPDVSASDRIKSMAPKDLVEEFANIMPFTIDKWVECGGKKDARTIVPLLIAQLEGTLEDQCALFGVSFESLM